MNPDLQDQKLRTLFIEQRQSVAERTRPFAVTWQAAQSLARQSRGAGWWVSKVGPATRFALFVLALSVGFGGTLVALAKYAAAADVYRHAPVIPLVSGFLIWRQREALAGIPLQSSPWAAVLFFIGALALGTQ